MVTDDCHCLLTKGSSPFNTPINIYNLFKKRLLSLSPKINLPVRYLFVATNCSESSLIKIPPVAGCAFRPRW